MTRIKTNGRRDETRLPFVVRYDTFSTKHLYLASALVARIALSALFVLGLVRPEVGSKARLDGLGCSTNQWCWKRLVLEESRDIG